MFWSFNILILLGFFEATTLHVYFLSLYLLQLLLMKRGGQVIYAGPLGRESHKLIEYFEL